MYKTAEIITKLQPHQLAALKRALDRNLILAHSTGSGKTLTSIAIADALGKPTTVLTPASLVENFKKELRKHKKGGPKVDVLSLTTAAGRNYEIPKGNTLIIDEAHALRNTGTLRHDYVKSQIPRAGRVFALTGTPAYNQISDWAPLVNLVAKEQIVPETPTEFKHRYVQEDKVYPNAWQRMRRIESGVIEKLRREKELKSKLAPYVDVFDAEVEKPERIDQEIYTGMSPEQLQMYDFVQSKVPRSIREKIRSNLPPSKAESRMMNAFLTGMRQVANTAEGYDEKAESGEKIKAAVKLLNKFRDEHPGSRAFVYSNFLDSGVGSYAKALEHSGLNYGLYTGQLSSRQKKALVDQYNAGKLDVLLASGAGSEGLDLKGTRLIQLLEPHWNDSRTEQVIGRGIRYKSHADLPPEDRNVTVQKFYSRLPEERTLWHVSRPTSVDEYLKARSKEKRALMDKVKTLFR